MHCNFIMFVGKKPKPNQTTLSHDIRKKSLKGNVLKKNLKIKSIIEF